MEPDHVEEPADATPDAPPPPEAAPEPEPAAAVEASSDEASDGKPDHAKRFLAQLIDGILAGVLFWVLIFVTLFSTIGFILAILLAGGYFLVRDGLNVEFMKGRSIGKKIMKLRPIRLDGAEMDLETSVKRNWMFGASWLSSLPFLGFLGTLIGAGIGLVILYECYKVLTDNQARRWGDELAGTRVIESAS